MDRVVLVNMIGGVSEDENPESFELKDMNVPEVVEQTEEKDGDQTVLPAFPPTGDQTSVTTRAVGNDANSNGVTAATPLKMNKNSKVQNGPEQAVESGFSVPLLLCALVACMGGILGGFSHGFPSPTLLELQQAYEGGERTTAFPSNSFYAGLFGVSCQQQPAR